MVSPVAATSLDCPSRKTSRTPPPATGEAPTVDAVARGVAARVAVAPVGAIVPRVGAALGLVATVGGVFGVAGAGVGVALGVSPSG